MMRASILFVAGYARRYQVGPCAPEQPRSRRFRTTVKKMEAMMLNKHPLLWNRMATSPP